MKKQRKLTATGRQLQADWVALQDKWASVRPFSRAGYKPPPEIMDADYSKLEQRVLASGKYTPHGGTAKPVQMYTGDKVLGITVMHKSCLQPVFTQEEAVDAAHMRR